jgi:5-methylcytosine-specific restriction protein A
MRWRDQSSRPGVIARIRGRRGVELRRRLKARQPLCPLCFAQGVIRLAEEIDHRTPLHKGGDNSADNLQPLCRQHHAEKTRRDLGQRRPQRVDATGWPLPD